MSTLGMDLAGLGLTSLDTTLSTAATSGTQSVTHTTNKKAGQALEMSDFLQLMVATFQNQTIDNTADISDMMNQMVQMSVVQSLTNLTTLLNESNSMTYAASLVGKSVTISSSGGQIEGVVTGTGMVNGQQAIFVGNHSYWLSDVLAVGKLPAQPNE